MGLNARNMLEQHFTKAKTLKQWETVLQAVTVANEPNRYLARNLSAGAANGDRP
jgi:hypothetical protein